MTTHTDHTALEARLHTLTSRALSPTARYGHVALLLLATLMCTLLAALIATEPALPARTQASFVVMLAIGGAWMAYASWVLVHRRPLMAGHRVVAGWMAVAFCGGFLVAACFALLLTGSATALAAAASGFILLAAAIAALTVAGRHRRSMCEQRDVLERQLARHSANARQ